MAGILNFGSLNIDYVYDVPHFVRAGETLASEGRSVFCGGKGLNQSIALGRAGAEVFHAGAVGSDGNILVDVLSNSHVDVSLIQKRKGPSGHAVIQRTQDGQNCILVYGGANMSITSAEIFEASARFGSGDFLVLQNEINMTGDIIQIAKKRGMTTVFNPSPINNAVLQYPLELVDIFILNEIEAAGISGESEPFMMISELCRRFPNAAVVLTLGKLGVKYMAPGLSAPIEHGIYKVNAVDTTAAGDTFTGYFIASVAKGLSITEALRRASLASALAVSRCGAEPSIPYINEVLNSRLQLEIK